MMRPPLLQADRAWPLNEVVRRLRNNGENVTASELISTYIGAKDSNRAHLMGIAFAPDAALEMVVNAGTISFPPHAQGLDAITNVLVRRFGQTFENVYTFCLCAPPNSVQSAFTCAWLVGMSEKESGVVRVGCGRYDWSFSSGDTHLINRLRVTIEQMHELPATDLSIVMKWLACLPYPWCPVKVAIEGMPQISELQGLPSELKAIEA